MEERLMGGRYAFVQRMIHRGRLKSKRIAFGRSFLPFEQFDCRRLLQQFQSV